MHWTSNDKQIKDSWCPARSTHRVRGRGRGLPFVLQVPHGGLQMLTVILELVYAQLGIGTASWRLLVDQDLQPFAVTDNLVNAGLHLVLHQVNVVPASPLQTAQLPLHLVHHLVRLMIQTLHLGVSSVLIAETELVMFKHSEYNLVDR